MFKSTAAVVQQQSRVPSPYTPHATRSAVSTTVSFSRKCAQAARQEESKSLTFDQDQEKCFTFGTNHECPTGIVVAAGDVYRQVGVSVVAWKVATENV